MKKRYSIIIFAILLLTNNIASASRQLERVEILEIIKTLTDKAVSTWIPYGTIKGTHIEYSASDGSIIESTEQVKYDGNRFYWEINISSQKHAGDDIPKELARDLKNNAERIFVWDGERYSMYFATTNNAIVFGDSGQIPVNVDGPLTAGVISWGFGSYSYANLATAELSAIENYKEQIVLTVKEENLPEMVFLLDPSQNYALLTYWLNNSDGLTIIKIDYSDFKMAGNMLIPTDIIIEHYNQSSTSSDLHSHDEWDITSISLNPPKPSEFVVPYRKNAFVEFRTSEFNPPLSYNFTDTIDTESLLQKRLEIVSTNSVSQNCATIAIEHVFSQLGKELTSQQLVQLVGADNSTSLYDMLQIALDSDFNAAAVVTDMKSLKKLKDCQIILYLPDSKHYVVLENIDSKYAWIVDLDSDKFYYRTALDDFKYLWNEGIALLISDQSFDLGGMTEVNNDDLKEIIGSTGGGVPNYSCTDPIQSADTVFCPSIGNLCLGRYWEYFDRLGCIEDDNGGTCLGSKMIASIFWSCKTRPDTTCTYVNAPTSRYMRACM